MVNVMTEEKVPKNHDVVRTGLSCCTMPMERSWTIREREGCSARQADDVGAVIAEIWYEEYARDRGDGSES